MNTHQPSKPYRPSWWCSGPHVQTIYARLFRPYPKLQLNRVRINTSDNDFFDIDILDGHHEKPCVVILHGLAGNSEAPYVRSLLGEIEKLGWMGVAMNYRGCSGEPNKRETTYHSGKTDDFESLMKYVREREPHRKLFAVGFSIGGNILLKWMGEKEGTGKEIIEKAIALSVPYDLAQSVELLDTGFNCEVYTRNLLTKLKADTHVKLKQFPGLIDHEALNRCRTFREFDGLVTAPLNGFSSADDYWERSSSQGYLERIQVRTLLIHAADDPFFRGEHLPAGLIQKNTHLQLLLTEKGGHLGFVSGGMPFIMNPWVETEMIQFLHG